MNKYSNASDCGVIGYHNRPYWLSSTLSPGHKGQRYASSPIQQMSSTQNGRFSMNAKHPLEL